MVTLSKRARDEALQWERHTYDVMLLTRTVDATVARSEAALGRYVLDEERDTGTIYYNEWRRAGRQIAQLKRLARSPSQRELVEQLERLQRARGDQIAAPASSASRTLQGGAGPDC